MERTTVATIGVILIVLVAGFSAVCINGDSQPTEGDNNKVALAKSLESLRLAESDYPTRLLVLGNADLDDDLDDDDIAAVNSFITNGYNYVKDYFADANYDGIIDSKDVEYLRKLIDFEDMVVYYLNVDFKIASYNKSYPLNLANILTQTLEAECILCPGNIVATDARCHRDGGMGTFYTEFESVIDYSKVECIGSHKSPDREQYAVVAKHNGGYLTVWMNSQYTYNTGFLEDSFNGTTLQIVRLPSWELASTISGILTAGYLFDKPGNNTAWENANKFAEWYDGINSKIKTIADSIPDNERKKVISASYSSSASNIFINGSLAGEHINVVRIGIDDVTSKYFADSGISGTWYASLSKEEMTAFYQKYGLDLVVGTIGAPYNAGMTDLINSYNERADFISTMEGVSQMTSGFIIGNGPSELIFCILVGMAAYPELYSGFDIEDITNTYLKFMGTYGTGEGQWTYDTLALAYYGVA